VEGVINVTTDTDLLPQLAHAKVVVAGTSTCLLEASAMGVPALSLGLGVWSMDMIRNTSPAFIKHDLAHATEGWNDTERQYGIAVLRQHAQISYARPRFLSPRIKGLLEGLVSA
jgi:hypothetical protein